MSEPRKRRHGADGEEVPWDACEDYREALVSVCDELDEAKQFIVQLMEDMHDEPASWAVMSLKAFIVTNTHKWYGGNYEAWERSGYDHRS